MKKVFNVIIGILLVAFIALSVVLFIKHNELKEKYNNLSIDYDNQSSEYETLMSNFITVNSEKNTLQSEYDTLEGKYTTLQNDYNELEVLYNSETQVVVEEPADLSEYATDVSYEDIARTPDEYEGRALCYTGEVIQVLETDGETDLRIAVNDDWDDVLLCGYDSNISDKRVLEGDSVTVYGIYYGVYTYESTFGTDITVPLIWVDHIIIN